MVTELKILNLAFRPLSDEDAKEEIDLGDDEKTEDGTLPDEDDLDEEEDKDEDDGLPPEATE